MIKATLRPPSYSPELAIQTHRHVLSLARQEQAALLSRARKRSRRHARKTRETAFNQGYQAGLQECAKQFNGVLEGIRSQYTATVESAKKDVAHVAHHIVEHLIANYIEQHPEELHSWLNYALDNLQHSRSLVLRYNPRYRELIAPFVSNYRGTITTHSDPSLGDVDFAVDTPTGGVSFSWRELLHPLSVQTLQKQA